MRKNDVMYQSAGAVLALVLATIGTAAADPGRVCPPSATETVADGVILDPSRMSAPDPLQSATFEAFSIASADDASGPVANQPQGREFMYLRAGTLDEALSVCNVFPSKDLCGMRAYGATQFFDPNGAALSNGQFSIGPGAVVHLHACSPAEFGLPYVVYLQVIQPVAISHD